MTPEERAEKALPSLLNAHSLGISPTLARQQVAAAIREAIAEERETCAWVAIATFDEHRLFEGVRDGGSIIAAAIRNLESQPCT